MCEDNNQYDWIKFFASEEKNSNFLCYLNEHGSQDHLVHLLNRLEESWPNVSLVTSYIFTRCLNNKVWEIPTNELCQGIIQLCKILEIKTIHEMAAGMGLLSARINALTSELKCVTTNSKKKTFGIGEYTFADVMDVPIGEINDSESDMFVVSWPHGTFETDLLKTIRKHSKDYVMIVGEATKVYSTNVGDRCIVTSYGNTLSSEFQPQMKSMGYDFVYLQFKQLCFLDNFTHDKVRKTPNSSRSITTLYFKSTLRTKVFTVIEDLRKNNPQWFSEETTDDIVNRAKSYFEHDKQMIKEMNQFIDGPEQKNFSHWLDHIVNNGAYCKIRLTKYGDIQYVPTKPIQFSKSWDNDRYKLREPVITTSNLEPLFSSPYETKQILGRVLRSQNQSEQQSLTMPYGTKFGNPTVNFFEVKYKRYESFF